MAILNYTTTVDAFKTASEIEYILMKHKAKSIMKNYDGESITGLSFLIDTGVQQMCSLYADITRSKFGEEQGTEDCKEWCAQSQIGEDTFYGDYFWETEYPRQYLHMRFHM